MRRNDREVTNFDELVRIMEKCDVCRLALHDDEYPYILPLNFGMRVEDGQITLYFHGASEGKKLDLIAKNNKAGFEMDCSHRLVTDMEAGICTMEYESVIGNGVVEIVPDEEKYDAICTLMAHYPVSKDFKVNEAVIPRTTVFKLAAKNITGKARMKAQA